MYEAMPIRDQAGTIRQQTRREFFYELPTYLNQYLFIEYTPLQCTYFRNTDEIWVKKIRLHKCAKSYILTCEITD